MRIFIALSLVLLSTAASAAPDPLLDKVIAGAKAVPASGIAFDRVAKGVSQEKSGATETTVKVDRWDGKQMTPVSIDGKPVTTEDAARIRKETAGRPVPGYHRIADYLSGGARRVPSADGRIVYRIDKLPKGSINISGDRSADMVGEAVIDASGAVPIVSRLRIFLPKPLSFFMVAKLDSFEVVNDYRPGPGGRPALFHSLQTMAGSQFGKTGTTRTDVTYTPLR
nr:hypothetical protein [Polymorphobacter sp.]